METRKIEIEVPEGKTAEWVDGVLTLVDEKDTRPITERIKTFEDACNELGHKNTLVHAYECWNNDGLCNQPDIDAYLKLRIICAALNEGWEPKFTKEEWHYYPWFYLYTKVGIENIDDNDECRMVNIDDYITEYAGLVSESSYNVPSHMAASFSHRLCLKNEELAIYCGKQFIDIWADFVLIRK